MYSGETKTLLDSIQQNISYDNLHNVIQFSKRVLKIGEQKKDTFLILRALHHLGRRNQFLNNNYKSITYFEKEMALLKKPLSQKVKNQLNNTEISFSEIYAQLGNNYARIGENKIALDYYKKSEKFATEKEQSFYKAIVPSLIGNIKIDIKEYNEALAYFKKALFLLENSKGIKIKTKLYNSGLATLKIAYVYLAKNKIDSAKFTLKEGKLKKYNTYSKSLEVSFKVADIKIDMAEGNYEKAIQKFNNVIPVINKINSSALLVYYQDLATCYAKLNRYQEACSLMEKGILFRRKNSEPFGLTDDYKILAKYYRRIGNIEKSNEFYEKYVLNQTAVDKRRKQIIETFHKDKIENLTLEKEKQQKTSSYLLLGGVVVIGLLILYLFNLSKKRKHETQKLEALLSKVSSSDKSVETKIVDTKERLKKDKLSDITEETTQQILDGLQKLEQQEYYLKQDCNSYNVAKKIKTNTSYLSKVINAKFDKNFNTYINDLRINYALIKLKEDTRFRSYSVKSIAQELGYKSADSFSKYFKFRTGLQPSVYIKKLNELA